MCQTQAEVRAHARAVGLPNQARRDSQGICFLGKVKFTEFVKEHLGVWPGCIIEQETGEVIGYHQGFWFHTLGQRKGIPLSGGPWSVPHLCTHCMNSQCEPTLSAMFQASVCLAGSGHFIAAVRAPCMHELWAYVAA